MKHGDKAKAKSAKAKASGKEVHSKKSGAESKGAAQGPSKAAKAAGSKEISRKAAEKIVPAAKGGNGKGKDVRPAPGTVNFSNPVIGEAFRRAVKKYSTAFRRLTD